MDSTFADRLWWARQRARMGATRLARQVGCAQSLISSLERNEAKGSKLTRKFADALSVDANWLAHGDDPQPAEFDAEEVRKAREAMIRGDEPDNLVSLGTFRRAADPRWSNTQASTQTLDAPASLQSKIIQAFMPYVQLVGLERARAFLAILDKLAEVNSVEEPNRKDQVRPRK